jgi:hypothetical protein
MADAVKAQWHGHNYQSRIFWQNALNLLDSTSGVIEVTFEADGPKAFDDVVVKYDPPIARSGAQRVPAEYHQVKWHVASGGRFGYEDFIDPAFIGAQSASLLQRLQQALATASAGSHFSFITTYRIKDGDPLADLVSGHDKTLLTERLFDGTTDKSRMGKVRKCWRDHLGLASDEELLRIVQGLRVFEGHRSLDELRTEINLKAQVVGLLTCSTSSDFRYDELARQLKVRGLNTLTRELFLRLCREEGLLAEAPADLDPFLPIAIRSFLGIAADIVGAAPENTLLLTAEFRQRYLRDDREWQRDIRPMVEAFLREAARRSAKLRLVLDAHASIAFLSGSVLDLKSGVETHLVQKGRVGTRVWRADDGSAAKGARFEAAEESLASRGHEIAIAISVSQPATPQARAYIAANLPNIGKVISFAMPAGPGQQSVVGGEHASALAEQVSNCVREVKAANPDALVHIFAACPNSLMFFLGQHHQGIAPCIVYEFDFDRRGHKTYQPSFTID